MRRLILACLLPLVCSVVVFFGVACSNEQEPLQVWTAADHVHPPDNLVDPTRVPQQERPDLTVGELLWQGRCARCHGPTGQGGAEASLDLTSVDWQATLDDEAIARIIANGKPPAMPSFADLLSGTQIKELVKHIRAFGRRPE
ncbi:MAG: cytochrome c [Deltaproteobacteria bacterium]|nr:cytochrome c [Deltaproteobacteria bacterium]